MNKDEKRRRIEEALKRASQSVAGMAPKQLYELTEKAFKMASGK